MEAAAQAGDASKPLPICATCDYYQHPHEVDRSVMERSGMTPPGFCQRYPQTIAKQPRDWCGEWVFDADGDAGRR